MHNISYLVYEENTKKSVIMADIQEMARRDGDGYDSKMTWHDNVPPLDSYEDAKSFIQQKDNGWYSDHAVRFKDYSKAVKTAKISGYEAKINELLKAATEYRETHSIHTFQAKHIGCPKCNSKLNKDYISGERCPLCRTDLRSKTTLDKIEWYRKKVEDYRNRIESEKAKQTKKCQIKWLVKCEYHS